MFFKQKDPFEDKVKCDECKHWIDKRDAKIVRRTYEGWHDLGEEIYCPMHKKSYDRTDEFRDIDRKIKVCYFKTLPEHEIEVDENGNEIKKK